MARLRGRSWQLSHSQVISLSLFAGSDLAAARNSEYSGEAQGGLGDATLKLVDVGGFLYRGQLENNVSLARGDIVYVPLTELGTSEQYLEYAVKAFQPILSAES